MRKRFLAALVTGAMMVGGLTGCGNQSAASNEQSSAYNSSATTSGYVDENGAHAGDDGTFANVGGGSSQSSEPSADASNDPAEVSSSDENLEQSESESNSEETTQSAGRPSVRPQAEEVSLDNLHGIIAAYLYYSTAEPAFPMARIYCIDPQTGEATLVNDFGQAKSGSTVFYDTCYSFPQVRYTGYEPNYQKCFSDDFRMMAVTMNTKVTTEYYGDSHAGWLDEDGNFHDVIAALGWGTKSEFDEPVVYSSVGFMDDGRFLFLRSKPMEGIEGYFAIPTDNLTEEAVEEFETTPFEKPYILVDEKKRYNSDYSRPSVQTPVTDQLDETHFLCNYVYYPKSSSLLNASVSILNIETGEETACVTGDAMATWCGVVDPTGAQIAFFAANPKSARATSAIYTMPLDASSSPQKLESDYIVNYPNNLHFELDFESSYSILIDWR